MHQRLRADGSVNGDVSSELLARLVSGMVTLRALDASLVERQQKGELSYFLSSFGEEAAIVGAALALEDSDVWFPSPRDHGVALTRGWALEALIAQLFGTASDRQKGHSRPGFLAAKSVRMPPVSGSIGAHLAHAVGYAWASVIAKKPVVTVASFGDGVTSSAEFHNALNFAGVFKVPVVFFCRNNGKAGATPVAEQTASETLAEKAVAYGFRGARVDGGDAVAVHETMTQALQHARMGAGATLVEAVTFGVGDPVARMRLAVSKAGVAFDEAAMVDQAESRLTTAIAHLAPKLSSSTLFDDVFHSIPAHLAEQRGALP